MTDLITYTDNLPGLIEYAASIADDWKYITLISAENDTNDSSQDGIQLIMDKTNTFYNGDHSISLIKLPMRDVYGESGSLAGFMAAMDGYLEILSVGKNRGGDECPFTKCWSDSEATAKYDLAYPRSYVIDDDGNTTAELRPRYKFCEFDG